MLRPFFSYYGAKWRSAPRYPTPTFGTIIEPFAGAAGYALRHHQRQVILVERNPVVASVWRYLLTADEKTLPPPVDALADLPLGTSDGARNLVGFNLSNGSDHIALKLSSWLVKARKRWPIYGWSQMQRARVASQLKYIRHWQVIEGDYTEAPNIPATWFVDPPYNNRAGRHYKTQVDHRELAVWCRARAGQVVVCESVGAEWLPFRPMFETSGIRGKSKEAIWVAP